MERLNTAEYLGRVAFIAISNDFHRPFINGKCNRHNIEEAVLDGVYNGELKPMSPADVEMICDTVDDLIAMYGRKD